MVGGRIGNADKRFRVSLSGAIFYDQSHKYLSGNKKPAEAGCWLLLKFLIQLSITLIEDICYS
jgi:hypothetical protein